MAGWQGRGEEQNQLDDDHDHTDQICTTKRYNNHTILNYLIRVGLIHEEIDPGKVMRVLLDGYLYKYNTCT